MRRCRPLGDRKRVAAAVVVVVRADGSRERGGGGGPKAFSVVVVVPGRAAFSLALLPPGRDTHTKRDNISYFFFIISHVLHHGLSPPNVNDEGSGRLAADSLFLRHRAVMLPPDGANSPPGAFPCDVRERAPAPEW